MTNEIKNTNNSTSYLDTLAHHPTVTKHFNKENASVEITKKMKEYFPQFSNEINTQDKLVYKLFASILRREINLSDATSIQQQRLGINLGKLATEITEQRAKIESLINRVKSTTEKTKLKDIYKELHGSPLIQIPDTICNKTIPSTPIQKDSQMKLLLDSILRFIQLIINFIQELFTPSSEEDIMVKKLKKCQKASEPIVQLNKEYQSILNECRFVGNFLKTSNISIFDVEHSTENSEVLNAFLNNRNLTFSAKEKESIQWIKSIMTGNSSQYDGQFAVDRGRSILIFEENGEEVLNSTPYNTPGFSENEQTNKTRKNQLEQTFEKINNWTQVNSASQFLIYILLCQTGLYPLEAFVQKKQMSLGKLSPDHLMLTSGVLGEPKFLTYKINKKRNIITIHVYNKPLQILNILKGTKTFVAFQDLFHEIDITDKDNPILSTREETRFLPKNEQIRINS